MFEGFKTPASLVVASKTGCTGVAEAGARERASESGCREVARGVAQERAAPSRRRKADRRREKADCGSRAEAGCAAAELSHFLKTTFVRRTGWRATHAR